VLALEGRLKGIPIGIDDFKKLMEHGHYFVDKSLFIKEIIDDASEVKLITRPRRFGKTLNLSMLRYFFEKTDKDNSILFKDLKIWQQGDRYINEHGKYPVVSITLKDVKFDSYEKCLEMIKSIMSREYLRHDYILRSSNIRDIEKKIFYSIANREASEVQIAESLGFLTELLYRYHGERVVVLIDEYDTPINYGFIKGYYEKIIDFIKIFLGTALKNNINLKMGVITGIYRVAKESVFSDLNNLYVSSVISESYSDKFGFLEDEVRELLTYYGIDSKIDEVKNWYNGYVFGKDTVIYNPWSIINYVKDKCLQPYWVNTSSNDLIAEIFYKTNVKIKQKLELLIQGQAVPNVMINSNINFRNIIGTKMLDEEVFWNFLIVSGYLKTQNLRIDEGRILADVKIPNKEIAVLYEDIIMNWFKQGEMSSDIIKIMLDNLVNGKIKEFEDDFKYLVNKTFSSFDVGRNSSENFYHAFVLGLLVNLDGKYRILSNRESGTGRPDIMIIPVDKAKKGVIIEFKAAGKDIDKDRIKPLKNAVEMALKQIEEKRYEDELRNSGIREVIKIGIAFCGKEVSLAYEAGTV